MTYPHGQAGPAPTYHFDPNQVPDEYKEDTFAAAPPGWYTAEICEAEWRATKAGGMGINLQWRILGPRFANKRVFHWINVENDNQQAQGIGRGELLRVTAALFGQPTGFSDPAQLCNRQVEIRISKEHDSYQDEEVNRVKEVRALRQQQQPVPPHPQGPPQGYQQAPPQGHPAAPAPQAPAPQQGYQQPAPAPQDQPQAQPAQQQGYYQPPQQPAPQGPPPATHFHDDDIPFEGGPQSAPAGG